ncbi:MAG: sulfurtransferase-like selenium metabolism protein YedF [Desulfomonile tiedjei]|nr:sulfurtransferase-like selenium metabolism protein YedF [Desulfomonile tiedjei]
MANILTVDARGLSCPQPVLETKRVIDEQLSDHFKVLVDTETSRENVSRFARNKGFQVEIRENGQSQFEIDIRKAESNAGPESQEQLIPCPLPEPSAQTRNVVYVANACMGRGDDELGQKLMRGFLRTWIDIDPKPWRMVFINSGVKLTTVDDEAVEAVSMLQERGVEILSCGTCLQFFGLEDKLRVGKVTNMYEVIESMNAATKVISPD